MPTYQLMRGDRRVENGALHPALSSMFRVTDGLRMTMHQMLFVPIGEPTLSPDAPMTAAEVLDYAERNYSFHSDHGVCAGPRMMIEEFLAVLIDGRAPRDASPVSLDAGVRDALDAVDAALDYALYGLQAYAAVFSYWPLTTRTWERLHEIVTAWAQHGSPAARMSATALVSRARSVTERGARVSRRYPSTASRSVAPRRPPNIESSARYRSVSQYCTYGSVSLAT